MHGEKVKTNSVVFKSSPLVVMGAQTIRLITLTQQLYVAIWKRPGIGEPLQFKKLSNYLH
jgi:hypothetical protein